MRYQRVVIGFFVDDGVTPGVMRSYSETFKHTLARQVYDDLYEAWRIGLVDYLYYKNTDAPPPRDLKLTNLEYRIGIERERLSAQDFGTFTEEW
jgi:hypothetical protein